MACTDSAHRRRPALAVLFVSFGYSGDAKYGVPNDTGSDRGRGCGLIIIS